MKKSYRICAKCIMDTCDPAIEFDEIGVCNHCRGFERIASKHWFPNEVGARRLAMIISQIRADGKDQEYDCIIGLSGGADSSYMALKVHQWGMRPLVVHVDAGWNSELAVANIEKIVNFCGYDLYTHVVDWEEMRDLQVAFLRAGVANQDVPQDHVFFASMYHFAIKHNIRYILSGGNVATEGIFPQAWHGNAMDAINLRAIHRKFGERPLRTYNTISFFKYYLWYPLVRKMRTIRPLNYMPYNRSAAIKELESLIGWRSYGRKHGESIFTRFFQNYYLPTKFGYDKRRPHLSSMIVSGQITREEAMRELEAALYDPHELENDIAYICKKLQISRDDFNNFMSAPARHYSEFANWDRRHRGVKRMQLFIEAWRHRSLKVYS